MLSREERPQLSEAIRASLFWGEWIVMSSLGGPLLASKSATIRQMISVGKPRRSAGTCALLLSLFARALGAQEAENEVVVEGSRPQPSRPAKMPSEAGTTLGRDRLTQPGSSVGDALREAPGVQVTQSGGLGAPAVARLRGATAAQTPVYLGRVRINDEVGGVADLSTVPHFFLKSIEVYRSHEPGFLSQSGMGGAIVLVPMVPSKEAFSLQGEAGSFGTRALRAGAAHRKEDGERTLFIAAELEAADNDYAFEDSRGTLLDNTAGRTERLQNADFRSGSLWALGTQKLGRGRAEFLAHFAEREQGAPKLALVPSEEARVALERGIFAFDSDFPVGRAEDRVRASTRLVSAQTTIDDPQLELGTLSGHIRTPGERLEQEFEGQHRLSETIELRHMWTLGFERLRRFERQKNIEEEVLAAKRVSVRAAGSVEWRPLQSLVFDGLLAGRCFDTSETTSSVCSDFAPTGRASVRFEQPVWEIYANAGRYVRLPTLSELHGVGILVRGNPALSEEHGTVVGMGVRVQARRAGARPYAWADLAGFARHSSDLVTYVRTAQGYLHPVNRETSRTVGGEVSVGTRIVEALLLDGSVSLLDPRDTSPDRVTKNDVLPFLSRMTAHARIEYEWDTGRARDVSSVVVGASTHFQSSRYADPAGLGVIPEQTFVDLEFGMRIYRDHFHLRGRVSNLFNADRFDVVGFPLPGRSVFFSLEAHL